MSKSWRRVVRHERNCLSKSSKEQINEKTASSSPLLCDLFTALVTPYRSRSAHAGNGIGELAGLVGCYPDGIGFAYAHHFPDLG